MTLNPPEIATILAALRFYQRSDDPMSNDQIDELCEKLNTGEWLDLTSGAILVAINTQQEGDEPYFVGSAIPPEGADPMSNYGMEDLWAEWRETEEHPDSDSQFVEWLIEEKGWRRLGNVGSVTINV